MSFPSFRAQPLCDYLILFILGFHYNGLALATPSARQEEVWKEQTCQTVRSFPETDHLSGVQGLQDIQLCGIIIQ